MTVLANGAASLYYEVHGPASPAGTIVLLHGVGGNHASWFAQIAAWRDRYRLVVPDARGFGNSLDPEGLGRDGFLADLERILDAEGVDRCVLVGQSMGGGTAVDFACAHRDRVAALVLADTLFGIEIPADLKTEMAEVAQRTATWSQQERVLGATFRDKHPAQCTLYTSLASFNAVNVRTLKGTQAEHPVDALGRLGVPILFVVGQEDALFPPRLVQRIQERIAGSRFVELPKIGHSAYFESPKAFNGIIEYWLEGLAGFADAPQAATAASR